MDGILRGKCIVNDSSYTLTDEETELLTLGMNFIPSLTASKLDRSRNSQSKRLAADRLTRNIDISLFFKQLELAEARKKLIQDIEDEKTYTAAATEARVKGMEPPPRKKRKEQQRFIRLRGWLSDYVPSTWIPDAQSWANEPRIDFASVPGRSEDLLANGPETPIGIMDALRHLQSRADLTISKSDKGRNVVVWDTADYDREAMRQLTTAKNYKELSETEFTDRLSALKGECDSMTALLFTRKNITKTEHDAMMDREPAGSYIYFLPKTHQDKQPTSQTFAGRPIVATFTHVAYLLDKLLTAHAAFLLPRIPWSLRDTGDLIDRLPTEPLPATAAIATLDVKGLYPNIPWEDGFYASYLFYKHNYAALQEHCISGGHSPPPNPLVFKQILELVLKNSLISFKEQRFFHQLNGTAMGTCISVYFANAYMYEITKKIIHNPPDWLLVFLRFIDDIVLIVKHYQEDLMQGLIESISNKAIGYTIVPPQPDQAFLDLALNINPVTHVIETTPYWKPTASGAYLHPASNHPAHVLKAIPYSQFLRLRRNSSTLPIFDKAAQRLTKELTKMGYPRKSVLQSRDKVRNMDLSAPKSEETRRRQNNISTNTYKLILQYNQRTNWHAKQRHLSVMYDRLIAFYRNPLSMADPALADMLQSRSAKIIHSNESAIGSHFSKYIKIPRSAREAAKSKKLALTMDEFGNNTTSGTSNRNPSVSVMSEQLDDSNIHRLDELIYLMENDTDFGPMA